MRLLETGSFHIATAAYWPRAHGGMGHTRPLHRENPSLLAAGEQMPQPTTQEVLEACRKFHAGQDTTPERALSDRFTHEETLAKMQQMVDDGLLNAEVSLRTAWVIDKAEAPPMQTGSGLATAVFKPAPPPGVETGTIRVAKAAIKICMDKESRQDQYSSMAGICFAEVSKVSDSPRRLRRELARNMAKQIRKQAKSGSAKGKAVQRVGPDQRGVVV